jgi:hypothetical protein
MKRLISAVALATAAIASGCATYDPPTRTTYYDANGRVVYYDAYGKPYYRPMGSKADAVLNPSAPTSEGETPYREYSMFFKDRGLHQEVPSALTPKIVVVGPTAG